jgi:TPP-dependent pyruvate/acetoin dehydrogenase alpha subunit
VIYVCENNLYTEYTHYSETTAGDILTRATAFGLRPPASMARTCARSTQPRTRLVDRARRGEGPGVPALQYLSLHGHHVGDINREYYRSKQEEQLWKTERDPIANFGKWLVEQKLADAAALEHCSAELEAEMKKAVDFAVAAPYPTVDEVGEDVYA